MEVVIMESCSNKISMSLLAMLMCSCGGGEDSGSSTPTQNNSTNSSLSRVVYARDSWAAMDLQVDVGQRYKIKAAGTASSGGRGSSGQILECDASGCDFYARTANGTWEISEHNPSTALCGLEGGTTTADGYVVPTNNRGKCCSSMNRILTSYNGTPDQFVEKNECSDRAKSNQLLIKIVPEGVPPSEVAAIPVGRLFENSAYVVTVKGRVYLSLNDTSNGRANNTGSIQVTFEKVSE